MIIAFVLFYSRVASRTLEIGFRLGKNGGIHIGVSDENSEHAIDGANIKGVPSKVPATCFRSSAWREPWLFFCSRCRENVYKCVIFRMHHVQVITGTEIYVDRRKMNTALFSGYNKITIKFMKEKGANVLKHSNNNPFLKEENQYNIIMMKIPKYLLLSRKYCGNIIFQQTKDYWRKLNGWLL